MNERRKVLIKKLNKMGVFYEADGRVEGLTLSQLEYLHITKLCEHISVVRTQKKNQPAANKLAVQ